MSRTYQCLKRSSIYFIHSYCSLFIFQELQTLTENSCTVQTRSRSDETVLPWMNSHFVTWIEAYNDFKGLKYCIYFKHHSRNECYIYVLCHSGLVFCGVKWSVWQELYICKSKQLLTNYRYYTMYNIQCVCHC